MEIFRGWYRKSFSRKNAVWHRVCYRSSMLGDIQTIRTLCGRNLTTTQCDFNAHPINRCIQCTRSPGVLSEVSKCFAPIGAKSILTRSAAIAELRRLLKTRVYYVHVWGNEGVFIEAKWESDVSISIYAGTEIKINKKRIQTLEQVQADLGRFKSAIDCLCAASDSLALVEKRKKGLKGRLTPKEQYEYFQDLLYEAEK